MKTSRPSASQELGVLFVGGGGDDVWVGLGFAVLFYFIFLIENRFSFHSKYILIMVFPLQLPSAHANPHLFCL